MFHFQATSGSDGRIRAWVLCKWISHLWISENLTKSSSTLTITTQKIYRSSRAPRNIHLFFQTIYFCRKISAKYNKTNSKWQVNCNNNECPLKIYFSNEEGKFGDDRAVDYIYMPDRMVEDARNVSINLHGEHGKYVMMQLFFSDKWMLISEVTFISSEFN